MDLLIVVVVSIVVGSAFRRYVKRDASNSLLATIFFLPALLYWVSDKSPSELTWLGFHAKFEAAVIEPVDTYSVSVSDLLISSLSSNDPDFRLAAYFEECSEYFVIRPHLTPNYDSSGFVEYVVNSTYAIRSSLACGRFTGVVVLDRQDKYIGSYDGSFFAESLSIWAVLDGTTTIDKEVLANRIMGTTIFGAALRHPGQRITPGEGFHRSIRESATVGEAFTEFQEMSGSFLVVVDESKGFKGILTRDRVTDVLLNALVSAS